MALRVETLTPAEVQWRDNQVTVATLLAERYTGVGGGGVLPPLTTLDEIVDGWLADDDSRVDINIVVNGVGIAMGQHLADGTGLAWVIATDEYGTDVALYGQPGDILIYPANAVAKRLANGEGGFVAALAADLTAGVRERQGRG